VKITINGEQFSYDFSFDRMPMSEALAIEKALGRRYVEWEMELLGGSAVAMAALVWLIWSRDGRDVELQDILDGKADLDFSETSSSFVRAVMQERKEAAAAAENPTSGAAPLTAPDGTDSTATSTSRSSRKNSG
jgi:hypothetical protein